MAAEFAGNNPVEPTPAQDNRPPAFLNGAPPRWAFWVPIIAGAIGGLMIGSLFFMAAYATEVPAYRIVFGIMTGACVVLPPLVLWLILRWMWTMLDEEPLKDQPQR